MRIILALILIWQVSAQAEDCSQILQFPGTGPQAPLDPELISKIGSAIDNFDLWANIDFRALMVLEHEDVQEKLTNFRIVEDKMPIVFERYNLHNSPIRQQYQRALNRANNSIAMHTLEDLSEHFALTHAAYELRLFYYGRTSDNWTADLDTLLYWLAAMRDYPTDQDLTNEYVKRARVVVFTNLDIKKSEDPEILGRLERVRVILAKLEGQGLKLQWTNPAHIP